MPRTLTTITAIFAANFLLLGSFGALDKAMKGDMWELQVGCPHKEAVTLASDTGSPQVMSWALGLAHGSSPDVDSVTPESAQGSFDSKRGTFHNKLLSGFGLVALSSKGLEFA